MVQALDISTDDGSKKKRRRQPSTSTAPPTKKQKADDDGTGNSEEGSFVLFLEYSPCGSLEKLCRAASERSTALSDQALWALFDCRKELDFRDEFL